MPSMCKWNQPTQLLLGSLSSYVLWIVLFKMSAPPCKMLYLSTIGRRSVQNFPSLNRSSWVRRSRTPRPRYLWFVVFRRSSTVEELCRRGTSYREKIGRHPPIRWDWRNPHRKQKTDVPLQFLVLHISRLRRRHRFGVWRRGAAEFRNPLKNSSNICYRSTRMRLGLASSFSSHVVPCIRRTQNVDRTGISFRWCRKSWWLNCSNWKK